MAAQRAMAARNQEAADEVERILVAAIAVMERVFPASPRVGDIVAEAGTSNKRFYQFFPGKEDLILAVMDRGVLLIESYLRHQMSKSDEPAVKID
jgi:AcrR family transcriptional regulator